jgi:hypothetical protein
VLKSRAERRHECEQRIVGRLLFMLEDYAVFLSAMEEVWRVWHARRGMSAPAARSLEAEACIVSVGLLRQFYEGHLSHVLPYCLTLPATWRCN